MPVLEQDRYLYDDIEKIRDFVVNMNLIEIAETELNIII